MKQPDDNTACSLPEKEILDEAFFRGIAHGQRAFCGPRLLQIDITNNCNMNCVGCWCHSDHLGSDKTSPAEKKVHLSLATIIHIIDDVKQLGTSSIQLAGSGEPLLHPDIHKIIQYIKQKGFFLEIVTNGMVLTDRLTACLMEYGVDKLTVSVWAGTASTYKKLHPNQPEDALVHLEHKLKNLFLAKQKTNHKPLVRMFNVISSYNYHEIEQMVQFGIRTGANQIEFQLVDIMPGKTEFLRLDLNHFNALTEQFSALRGKKDFITINEFDSAELIEFGRFIVKQENKDGFCYLFVNTYFSGAFCPRNCRAQHANENISSGYIEFFFNPNMCKNCRLLKSCSIDGLSFSKKVYFTSLVGVPSFLNRSESAASKRHPSDSEPHDIVPCLAGWDYARILSNGNVIPCCKGYRKPLGNIHEKPFKHIWHSSSYNRFRHKAKTVSKQDPYFELFECLKGCDNYGRNMSIIDEFFRLKLRDVDS